MTSSTWVKSSSATRDVLLCGPGAYVVLKALAFDLRGENKDAYDLFYVVRTYGTGLNDVLERFRPLLEDAAPSRRSRFFDGNS